MIGKKFEEYFERTGVMKSWFAKQIGTTPQALYVWIQEQKPIPREYWKKIVLQTGGMITLYDLMKNFIKDSEEINVLPGKTPDTCTLSFK